MNLKHLEAFLASNPSPTDVVVGKMYKVPCIRRVHSGKFRDLSGRGWIPVIGPIHDDKELIGFESLHLHYDSRFLTVKGNRVHSDSLSRLREVESLEDVFVHLGPVQYALKLRKCRRLTDVWTPVRFTRPLEEAHRRCRIGPDCLCPHRKIPLALGARLQDGSVVCAGHGLRWSAEGHLLPLEDPTEAPS
jgi:hypothetical protein